MGLFDFFKKNNKLKLPESYEGVVSQEDYNFMMETAIQYHKSKGTEIIKVDEGEIVGKVQDQEHHWYFDNLVRTLSNHKKTEWASVIHAHFDKLSKDSSAATNFFFKDFEYAAPLLRILLKGKDFEFGRNESDYVYRSDLPETHTFLVMEFEQKFHYLKREDIVEWNKSEEELFQIAIENIPESEVEVKEYLFLDKFTVFIFFSGDFASAVMLDLPTWADYAIGPLGSLLAIPTKGTAFAHPIEGGNILELVEHLHEQVTDFYHNDPGSITTNYYWYYEGRFNIFPIDKDKNGRFVTLPDQLWQLLNSHN